MIRCAGAEEPRFCITDFGHLYLHAFFFLRRLDIELLHSHNCAGKLSVDSAHSIVTQRCTLNQCAAVLGTHVAASAKGSRVRRLAAGVGEVRRLHRYWLFPLFLLLSHLLPPPWTPLLAHAATSAPTSSQEAASSLFCNHICKLGAFQRKRPVQTEALITVKYTRVLISLLSYPTLQFCGQKQAPNI